VEPAVEQHRDSGVCRGMRPQLPNQLPQCIG
jgi:hypothetical protein